MMRSIPWLGLVACLLATSPAFATDRNGGDDCVISPNVDWGDAPEAVLAYPGVIGHFPTCRIMSPPGTQEIPVGCAAISTFPGITGHIFHKPTTTGFEYWLGCYQDPSGAPMGKDFDSEGKMNQPSILSSFCDQRPTDCVENAYGLTFDQDECLGDGSDAGVISSLDFAACFSQSVTFTTHSCAPAAREVVLNILLDMNHDGDWNDVVSCVGGPCVYEWAVKNVSITLPPGCGTITSPNFTIGRAPGPSWMRISLTDDRVSDDYPWAGGAGQGGVDGGETEDYPAMILEPLPTLPSSWGSLKAVYR